MAVKSLFSYDTKEEMEEHRKIVEPIIKELYEEHGFVVAEAVMDFRNKITPRKKR